MHYHIQKPWKMKFEPRIKLNCSTYIHHKYVHIFLAGVEGTEEVSSSLLLNDQVVGYIALCRIILLLPNLRASSPWMGESREVTREWHVKGDANVRGYTARTRVFSGPAPLSINGELVDRPCHLGMRSSLLVKDIKAACDGALWGRT